MKRPLFPKHKGIVLFATLIISTVILIFLIASVLQMQNTTAMTRRVVSESKAYWASLAGLDYAKACVEDLPTWQGSGSDNFGDFTISSYDSGGATVVHGFSQGGDSEFYIAFSKNINGTDLIPSSKAKDKEGKELASYSFNAIADKSIPAALTRLADIKLKVSLHGGKNDDPREVYFPKGSDLYVVCEGRSGNYRYTLEKIFHATAEGEKFPSAIYADSVDASLRGKLSISEDNGLTPSIICKNDFKLISSNYPVQQRMGKAPLEMGDGVVFTQKNWITVCGKNIETDDATAQDRYGLRVLPAGNMAAPDINFPEPPANAKPFPAGYYVFLELPENVEDLIAMEIDRNTKIGILENIFGNNYKLVSPKVSSELKNKRYELIYFPPDYPVAKYMADARQDALENASGTGQYAAIPSTNDFLANGLIMRDYINAKVLWEVEEAIRDKEKKLINIMDGLRNLRAYRDRLRNNPLFKGEIVRKPAGKDSFVQVFQPKGAIPLPEDVFSSEPFTFPVLDKSIENKGVQTTLMTINAPLDVSGGSVTFLTVDIYNYNQLPLNVKDEAQIDKFFATAYYSDARYARCNLNFADKAGIYNPGGDISLRGVVSGNAQFVGKNVGLEAGSNLQVMQQNNVVIYANDNVDIKHVSAFSSKFEAPAAVVMTMQKTKIIPNINDKDNYDKDIKRLLANTPPDQFQDKEESKTRNLREILVKYGYSADSGGNSPENFIHNLLTMLQGLGVSDYDAMFVYEDEYYEDGVRPKPPPVNPSQEFKEKYKLRNTNEIVKEDDGFIQVVAMEELKTIEPGEPYQEGDYTYRPQYSHVYIVNPQYSSEIRTLLNSFAPVSNIKGTIFSKGNITMNPNIGTSATGGAVTGQVGDFSFEGFLICLGKLHIANANDVYIRYNPDISQLVTSTNTKFTLSELYFNRF